MTLEYNFNFPSKIHILELIHHTPIQVCPKRELDHGVIHHQPPKSPGNARAALGLQGGWRQLDHSHRTMAAGTSTCPAPPPEGRHVPCQKCGAGRGGEHSPSPAAPSVCYPCMLSFMSSSQQTCEAVLAFLVYR